MHRAVLLAQGPDIGADAIFLTSTILSSRAPAREAESETAPTSPAPLGAADLPSMLIGRTVDSVERDLIIGTLSHCLGNRTHAANILGISIRTLRNKLRQYSEEGVRVTPQPEERRGGEAWGGTVSTRGAEYHE